MSEHIRTSPEKRFRGRRQEQRDRVVAKFSRIQARAPWKGKGVARSPKKTRVMRKLNFTH